MLRVIDVTLRDGGYKNFFSFTERDILYFVQTLNHSGLGLVEIGYYGGPLGYGSNMGLTANISKDVLKNIRKLDLDIKIVVMLHPQNADENDFRLLKECGADLVRICIRIEEVEKGLRTVKKATDIGLIVSANFVRATTYSLKTLKDSMIEAENAGAHLVYFGRFHRQHDS